MEDHVDLTQMPHDNNWHGTILFDWEEEAELQIASLSLTVVSFHTADTKHQGNEQGRHFPWNLSSASEQICRALGQRSALPKT